MLLSRNPSIYRWLTFCGQCLPNVVCELGGPEVALCGHVPSPLLSEYVAKPPISEMLMSGLGGA